jgi:GTP-binding protein
MKKYTIKYLASAVRPDQWPPEDRPEILLVGRSNAGKSSLINALWGKSIAFVSSMPGKTQVLNFYNVENQYNVVDTPGYGFARKRAQIEAGFRGVEIYLSERPTLRGLVIVVDAIRKPEEEEEWIIEFCAKRNIPVAVALNKSDKLNQKERAAQKKKWSNSLESVFLVSSLKGTGVGELERFMYDKWLKEHT